MSYSEERLLDVFDRTGGCCHICHKKLCFNNYAIFGAKGCWEVEHSVPRARRGTERLNNLYAACISCNRSKGVRSTRAVRRDCGHTCAPPSTRAQARSRERKKAVKVGLLATTALLLLFSRS